MAEAFICSALRTPIGRYGGALAMVRPDNLAAVPLRALMHASTGFFSRGAWFAGGGFGVQASSRAGVSLSFTRSWGGFDRSGVARDRRELSGSVAYVVTPHVAVYGSTGRTIGTSDENGAGTSVGAGVTFMLAQTSSSR